MKTITGLTDVTSEHEVQNALEELAYASGQLIRYAITLRTIRTYTDEGYGVGYLRLVTEEVDKIITQHARLLSALRAASLQVDTPETEGAAA